MLFPKLEEIPMTKKNIFLVSNTFKFVYNAEWC